KWSCRPTRRSESAPRRQAQRNAGSWPSGPAMKFREHKAKEIFARYGIPVPRGSVASKPEEITDPPLPCMVKAQVLVGGRGKAGGIRPAETLEEARQVAGQILGMDIHGYR